MIMLKRFHEAIMSEMPRQTAGDPLNTTTVQTAASSCDCDLPVAWVALRVHVCLRLSACTSVLLVAGVNDKTRVLLSAY